MQKHCCGSIPAATTSLYNLLPGTSQNLLRVWVTQRTLFCLSFRSSSHFCRLFSCSSGLTRSERPALKCRSFPFISSYYSCLICALDQDRTLFIRSIDNIGYT